MTIEGCDFHPVTSTFSRPNRRGFLLEVGKRRCAYSGAPALLPSILYTGWIKFRQSHNCDSPRKENGLVDRLRHLAAQTFATNVVGAEMLPRVNPAQTRLLRRR
jgi:hypothetical protein